jgi:hypothetical protein
MSDMTLTDMTPFFDRHERRSRRVVIALVCTSLIEQGAEIAQ